MLDYQKFIQDSSPFRGVDFWMLNDRLEDEQIRFELQEMHDKGVSAFIARTYTGLKSDYPGPGFKQKMHTVVECARELGMKLFLQAGFMPEAVFGLPEKFTACCVKENEKGEYEFSRTEYYVDMFDPEAVKFYLQKSYEDMWSEFAPEFGKTILSVWVDEPSYSGAGLPWSDTLAARYKERWQEEIHIPSLFHDLPGSSEKRYRYWNTVVRTLEESYFKQVRRWCHDHNLLFSGHLMGEATFHSNFYRGGAMMPFYRYLDIPGIDCLMADMCFNDSPLPRLIENQTVSPDLYTTPLQCVSAAAQAGKELVLCEMYGVSSENLALRDQLYLFDRFASFGINCRSVHGYFYSLRGRGKRAYPPHINYYQPYWEQYGHLTRECALNAWFVSQGERQNSILLLLPWNTAASLYARGEMTDGAVPALAALESSFLDLERLLTGNGINFDLGDEFIMEDEGSVSGGSLVIGKCAYKTVVLPRGTVKLADSTVKLLKDFLSAGGRVLSLGDTPLAEAEVCLSEARLLRELLKETSPLLESDDLSALQILHRKGEKELLFVFNTDCRKEHRITLLKNASLFESDGSLSQTGTHFTVPAGGALRLVFQEGECPPAPCRQTVSRPLPFDWQIKRNSPNALVLEFARFKRESDLCFSAQDYPVLAVHEMLTDEKYTGIVTLRFEVTCAENVSNCALALEDPEAFTVTCNGEKLTSCASGFFCAKEFETLPLPPLKKGINVLELARHFEPLEKPVKGVTELFQHLKGVELEVPFLIGDFALETLREPTRCQGVVRLNREFTLVPEKEKAQEELTAAGYPFFAGSLTLSQSFEWDAENTNQVSLRFEHLNTAALEVRLNGAVEGIVYMPPYKCPLRHLKKGTNTLEVTLFSSLRNLLGPSHRPGGEYGRCFGGYGKPNKNWIGAVDETGRMYPDWQEHRTSDTTAWCESFMQVPFGFSGVILEQDKEE